MNAETNTKYAIIGGSIAGLSAARTLRGFDPDGTIAVVAAEKGKPYYRPLIPLLINGCDFDISMPDNPLESGRITPLYDTAAGLDPAAKEVLLESGGKLRYDKLLIATGSRPVVPPIPGIGGENVFPLRCAQDALRIRDFARGMSHAVILGGGLVGIKAALALGKLGLSVTIVEKLDRILYGRLDRRAAELVLSLVTKAGITVLTTESVAEIQSGKGKVGAVKLEGRKTLQADIVIVAVGVEANTAPFARSGIKINHGVVVDEMLRTSAPGVFAAGDVAEYVDAVTGASVLSGLWTTAEEMGRTAGRNMAGENKPYRGFISTMNAVDILGTPFISVGHIDNEQTGLEAVVTETAGGFRKLVFDGDVLVGVVLAGDVARAGIYTSLIRNRIPLGDKKPRAISGELSFAHFFPGSL